MSAARRNFLASAGGLAAAIAARPALPQTPAPDEASSPLATIEDYARAQFEVWPKEVEAEFAAATADWQDVAQRDHMMMGLVIATMRRGPLELTAVVANDPDQFGEFALKLGDVAKMLRNKAELLDAAAVRIMCGLARHSMGQS